MSELDDIENRIRHWSEESTYEYKDSDDFHTLQDDLYRHFCLTDLWYWCDVTIEAKRLWDEVLFPDDTLDDNYPVEYLIDGVAAQSAQGVYRALARVLGVDVEILETISDYVYENQNEPYEVPDELKTISLALQKYVESRKGR